MSATLGALLATLQPDWSISLLERRSGLAQESSCEWNNSGTGHSGFCELSYMPDPLDPTKPIEAARQFLFSRQWWAHLADNELLPDPSSFINCNPHMNVAFGQRDVQYLRKRYATLRQSPWFAGMVYTEDPAVIAQWTPLLMDGRESDEPVAATRCTDGTEVNFGALSRALANILTTAGGVIRTGYEVTMLRRRNGLWHVSGWDNNTGQRFELWSRFVYVGAGGVTLRLMQKARVPEVRGYCVLPVGASFLRCDSSEIVAKHHAKLYSQAPTSAYPMAAPHLDKRIIGGRASLLFGPYSTFSTRLLKHGKPFDLLTTLRWHNAPVLLAAGLQNLPHLRYLITQLATPQRSRFAQLRRFYPKADPNDWTVMPAGQRVELVTPDDHRLGAIHAGRELVTDARGSIAGLIGTLPGASTALPVMIDLLQRCFPQHWIVWKGALADSIPMLNTAVDINHTTIVESLKLTAKSLRLEVPRNGGSDSSQAHQP